MRMPVVYRNGNTRVTIWPDGTKWREWPDGEEPSPEWPESIDLKITDYCDAGCPWCHESSTIRGRHGDLDEFFRIASNAPRGMEIAIGGGNPLSHPGFMRSLSEISDMGFIANLTVNSFHLNDPMVRGRILDLVESGLINGLGISYSQSYHDQAIRTTNRYNNAILHLIAGVDSPSVALKVNKALVLGYKSHGRGLQFNADHSHGKLVRDGIKEWRSWLRVGVFPKTLCFDNLATRQLSVRDLVGEESWRKLYMGDDGKFTLYVDLVEGTFAMSSTSERLEINGRDLTSMLMTTSGKK